MRFLRFSAIGAVVVAATIGVAVAGASSSSTSVTAAARSHSYGKAHSINCTWSAAMCAEVTPEIAQHVFGHYVGHDEPSVLFDSNTPGAGNRQSYNIILPKEPSAKNPTMTGKSYQFELSGADWFGMAMCDTQSYPEQNHTSCPPDSNSNILDPATSPHHVGEAYMELQFYPPGWIPWPTWQVAVGASSCNPTKWCAALNIDSLLLNPVTGQMDNTACQNTVGEEPVNFAFITKNGKSTGPANPVDATTSGTYTPSSKDLFMGQGDHLNLKMFDTPAGFKVAINDLTTHQSGSMTASIANGFGQVNFNPTATTCTDTPYAFHPLYSTSSPRTRVTWAAGAYNIAMDTEIGHFQGCVGPHKIPATKFGLDSLGNPTTCPAGNKEVETAGKGAKNEHSDPNVDDFFCFPGSEALTYKVSGCTYTNAGFDGFSYQPVWPDGNTKLHPTPFQFTSPLTGKAFNKPYRQASISVDLPDIESQLGFQSCSRTTGVGCTHVPVSDDGKPALFYPFYSITHVGGTCYWQMGNKMPNSTNFGKDSQYGPLYAQNYTTLGGGYVVRYNDFLGTLGGNPCPQK